MKTIISLLLIFYFSIADEVKKDLTKMTNEELKIYFMQLHKEHEKVLTKSKVLDAELKKSEEELKAAKKLAKTVDKLNGMLGIEE